MRSHIGKVRQLNEDMAWCGTLQSGIAAAIVADGMGGHNAGEVASELAVDSLVASINNWDGNTPIRDNGPWITQMIRKANSAIYDTASLNAQYHNMGTTVVVALLDQQGGLVGHVGDSRAYRLRNGRMEQLTEDHTLVNELTKSGQLSPEEAVNHPRRNVLTRALGTDPEVEVDVQVIEWRQGDQLMLCSDGLTNMVDFDQLQLSLNDGDASLEEKADRLIELALEAGGDDNVTVALIAGDPAGADAGGGTA